MTKQELRQHIRTLKQQHLTGERSTLNVQWSTFNVILLYSALPDEVPTQALMDDLVAQGKTVLLPRVINDRDMELRRYTGPQDLQEGAYGILEPTGERFTDYEAIDVAIVPGMAFDAEGHRLGRGKGYYDRFLSRVPHLYKIGLCFSWQMVDHVPCDEHDVVMDQIIQI
ncbi:MAG: 5-formyltetrahydrofolate cyclo-ligase [Prevotella sp.]|nr:5-formyltetrahydrofolate cyclo-ligase [Prevotella sp.]